MPVVPESFDASDEASGVLQQAALAALYAKSQVQMNHEPLMLSESVRRNFHAVMDHHSSMVVRLNAFALMCQVCYDEACEGPCETGEEDLLRQPSYISAAQDAGNLRLCTSCCAASCW